MFLRPLCIAVICGLALTACGKPQLSRPQAEAFIQKSDEMQRRAFNVPLHALAVAKGEAQGIWAVQNYQLTLGSRIAALVHRVEASGFVLRQPAGINIQVTGIADVPATNNLKEAQFAWEYAKLPPLVRRFAARGGSGSATFRLFDDGWRLENVSTASSDVPIPLSAAEIAEERADAAAAFARRAREEEARRAEAQRIAQAIQTAKAPTKTILSRKLTLATLSGNKEQVITVSDVSITFRCTSFNCDENQTVWFGHINDVGDGPDPYMAIVLRQAYREHLYQGSILVPVGSVADRKKLVEDVHKAIDAWRTRFAGLPAQAFAE